VDPILNPKFGVGRTETKEWGGGVQTLLSLDRRTGDPDPKTAMKTEEKWKEGEEERVLSGIFGAVSKNAGDWWTVSLNNSLAPKRFDGRCGKRRKGGGC